MKKVAIGIDVGGTNTVFGLVDRDGNIFEESSIPTLRYSDFNLYLEDLVKNIKEMIGNSSEKYDVVGIGVGAPNANYYTGNIEGAANLPWKGTIHFVKELSAKFNNISTVMTNDANAAAIGEMVYGGAKGMKNFIVITLGTGVGSGIVVNGELVYGHTGHAGELGHIIVRSGGRECGCARKGCLETYASATGIKRTVFKLLADSNSPSVLRKCSFEELTAKMITEAAINGDALAIDAYKITGEVLGKALADTVAITSPEAIFLFGGLAKAGKYIFEPTQQSMNDNMLFVFKNSVKLLPSMIDDKNTAVLGASALIWQQIEKQNGK